jgi:hypothetical protein
LLFCCWTPRSPIVSLEHFLFLRRFSVCWIWHETRDKNQKSPPESAFFDDHSDTCKHPLTI